MHDPRLIRFDPWQRPPSRRQIVAQGLRRAFPVPQSGAFSDVLQAISDADEKVRG